MQGDLSLHSQFGEGRYVVYDAVGEVGRGTDEEDRVAVDEAGDAWDVNLVGGSWAGHKVYFDTEVGTSFAERCMCCVWQDPGTC